MFSRQAHDVYLGTRAIAVCLGKDRVWAHGVEGVDRALQEFGEWLAAIPTRPRLRLWLSGGLCRPFVMPPIHGLRGEDELQRAADSMASRQTGLEGDCATWIDSVKRGNSRIAVAMPRGVLDAILRLPRAGTSRRPVLVSIRPWWADVLRAALQQNPLTSVVATQDCDSLTVLAGQETFNLATTLSPVFETETADAALARLLLSAPDVGVGPKSLARLQPFSSLGTTERDVALGPYVQWPP